MQYGDWWSCEGDQPDHQSNSLFVLELNNWIGFATLFIRLYNRCCDLKYFARCQIFN